MRRYTQDYKDRGPLRSESIPGLVIAQEKSAILKLRFLCLFFVVPKGRFLKSL
jgi:hypothetical protein